MTSNYEKVGEFLRKFDLPHRDGRGSHLLDDETFLFRYHLILEECLELLTAHRKGDVVDAADALADLLYVVYGLAQSMGMPMDEVFALVHEANMRKVRADGADDPRGKRSSGLDLVKPSGWTPPNLAPLLRREE